jgi:hypothetical protein
VSPQVGAVRAGPIFSSYTDFRMLPEPFSSDLQTAQQKYLRVAHFAPFFD